MSDLDPSDAARVAMGGAEAAAEGAANQAASEGAQMPSGGVGGSKGISDVLLHTEPDIDVRRAQRDLGGGPAPAHAYIALRKVLHAVTESGGGQGMPAVGNGLAAAFHAMMGGNPPGEGATDDDVADALAEAAAGEDFDA